MLSSGRRPEIGAWLVPVVLVLLAAFCYHLFNQNIDYSPGHNPESAKKVLFVLRGTEDFFHPILMLLTIKAAAWLRHASDAEQVLLLGRQVAALFGIGFVLASYLLARWFVGRATALGCALATAVAPLTVVHMHYLKEDAWFVCFTTLSLAALMAMIRVPSRLRWVVFGVASGLAMSSKYIGAAVLLLAWSVPRLAGDGFDEEAFRRATRRALLTACVVFLVVNAPLFLDPGNFLHGLGNELIHPIEGHQAKILPFQFLWTFHLLASLQPGMTSWLLIPALVASLWLVLGWRDHPTTTRTLLVALGGYYMMIESTPMKPFPDFMRYAMPLVPLLAITTGMMLEKVASWPGPKPGSALPLVALCLLSLPAYSLSCKYNQALALDTRDVAGRILDRLPGPIVIEHYTRDCFGVQCETLTDTRPDQVSVAFLRPGVVRGHHYRYAAISSFQYERIMLSSSLWVHYPSHDEWAAYYRTLLDKPRLQISGVLPAMGFIDPTIQIVDLQGNAGELKQLAGSYGNDLVKLRFIDGRSS